VVRVYRVVKIREEDQQPNGKGGIIVRPSVNVLKRFSITNDHMAQM
jgi:hypothetical protein